MTKIMTELQDKNQNLENDLNELNNIQKKSKSLQESLNFAKQNSFREEELLKIYDYLVNIYEKENKLLSTLQNEDLLEDIKQLIDLNNYYIETCHEQHDKIESLNSQLAKYASNAKKQQQPQYKQQAQQPKQQAQQPKQQAPQQLPKRELQDQQIKRLKKDNQFLRERRDAFKQKLAKREQELEKLRQKKNLFLALFKKKRKH